jgi:sugar lactone lactonase YvrE
MHGRRAGRAARLLIGVVAAFALSLACATGPASAKQVYDYVYSGNYIDGSGSQKGAFPQTLGDIVYDKYTNRLIVLVEDSQAYISQFTTSGVPATFPGPGTDTVILKPGFWGGWKTNGTSSFSLDESSGATQGSLYLGNLVNGNIVPGDIYKFLPDGNELVNWDSKLDVFTTNTMCGFAIDPNGIPWIGPYNRQIRPDGTEISVNGRTPGEYVEPFGYFPKGGSKPIYQACGLTFDNEGYGYIYGQNNAGKAIKFNAKTGEEAYQFSQISTREFAVDKSNNDVFAVQGNTIRQFDNTGTQLSEFGAPAGGYEGLEDPAGITVDPTTHDVWVANRRNYGGARHVERFVKSGPFTVPTTKVVEPGYTSAKTATLKGVLNPDGIETTDCHFEWGPTQAFGNVKACIQGNNQTGSADIPVTANVEGLTKGTVYYYRLSSKNGNGRVSSTGPKRFIAQVPPTLGIQLVENVNTDGVRLSAFSDPGGGDASIHFEYGIAGQGFEGSSEEKSLARLLTSETVKVPLNGLTPDTRYQFRAVLKNQAATVTGPTQTFRTYLPDPGVDPCPNALARQQTGSALLDDCRAYELVSAPDAGGFDVESDLVSGQSPLEAYPGATDRLLYSVHAGVIPGIAGSPTNLGRDPYVAHRGSTGWSTEYVGLPSNSMADSGAFGSPLLGADPTLNEFAFGGKEICAPCFNDGSTNVPVRLANGELIEGMTGSLNAVGNPSQKVAKPFSGDGSHFVFGSNTQFEPAGDAGGSIYDRNLTTGTTQVVSTLPNGTTMTGGEVAELDISTDGSRIVVGKKLSTDAKDNTYRHLYMHIGSSSHTVDLTEGASTGALFDGMSSDGSRVFLTTKDQLLGSDTDVSADIYEAAVDNGGALTLRLVTTKAGIPSNDDSCNPPGLPESWNAASGSGKCSPVAFAGGAGVATGNGTIYFVSPEKLDGSNGTADQPNLYIVTPGGTPKFVTTVDTSVGKPTSPVPNHPVVNAGLATGLGGPEGISVDQSNGDVYVFERTGGKLARYTSAGAEHKFTEGPGENTNKITGLGSFISEFIPGLNALAVDNAAGSPFSGDFYVTHGGSAVDVYEPSGKKLGALSGFGLACGVTVNPATGAVFVSDFATNTITRFAPSAAAPTPVTNANYTVTSLKTEIQVCQLAVDKIGHVYANAVPAPGQLNVFNESDFAAVPPTKSGVTVAFTSAGVATDPGNNDLYVDEGGQIARYDSSATLIQKFGSGKLAGSAGVGINKATKHVYASTGSNVVDFGFEEIPYRPIDQIGVTHGISQAETHNFADFQVSSDGRYALFTSIQPLTNFLTSGHTEIYRYDAGTETLDCPSCANSEANPATDTILSPYGLGLSDDGRVFFTSQESFALRDTNDKKDAYQWENGRQQLLSTGLSPHDSGLVTASADGTNAYFYTREKLVPEDGNGLAVRIYDARAGGGYVFDPPLHQCAASDECHGAGTEAPPPPIIPSGTGAGPEPGAPKSCRKGLVRRKGKCVKRPAKKGHHSKRHATRRNG